MYDQNKMYKTNLIVAKILIIVAALLFVKTAYTKGCKSLISLVNPIASRHPCLISGQISSHSLFIPLLAILYMIMPTGMGAV